MRAVTVACVVAALGWGCAPTITYDTGATSGRGAGTGVSIGPGGEGGAGAGAGAVGGAGSMSSSSSSSSHGGGAAGGLGPTAATCAAEHQSGSVFGAPCAYAPCSSAHAPPAMLPITANDGTSYCMDTRAVSAADYAAFLAAGVDPGLQPSRCLWNTTFKPGAIDPQTSSGCTGFDPVGAPDADVTCVDLCDAEAYCLWAGKRLCGRIGGGDIAYVDDGKPGMDQFTFACQTQAIPFVERPAATVFEWEPVCITELSADSLCNVRDVQCYILDNWKASRQAEDLGFRCCGD
jgi:formylglycine-generating enzyme